MSVRAWNSTTDSDDHILENRCLGFSAWAGAASTALILVLFAANRPPMERDRHEQFADLSASDEPEAIDALLRSREIKQKKRPPAPPPLRADKSEISSAPSARPALEALQSQHDFGDLSAADRLYRNLLSGDPADADSPDFAARAQKAATHFGGLKSSSELNSFLGTETIANGPGSCRTARAFLDERAAVQGLTYREASGYWSNSYVPGDPALRLLQARLAATDRAALQAFTATPLALHDAARPVGQPFDRPSDAALGVFLHADRKGIDAEGRLLLQVGLQATERHGGRRPAMNVALVLDLRGEVTDEIGAGMRALVTAFGQARDTGDRFSLVVAGVSGGTVVEPLDFKYGYLSVTLDRLLSGSDAGSGPTLGLADAVAVGLETVASADDPSSPLGTSAVVLITGRPLGPATEAIVGLAHVGAVAGVPLSAVAVGSEVALEQIDRVALAGQGQRRVLQAPAEAVALVDRELSAASRAVARAVRLRIRLAPGVRLVDVVGSERLDEIRAERVRVVEQSIDRRMARNLGIEADRGEDEEGIQIVIPSFYAGDSHVVLLDVSASGPGAIADVAVRYKDLVYLNNGVTRASLSLGGEVRAAGPLERNVLKNYLSWRLSKSFERAGMFLAAGNPRRATRLLTETRDLFAGLLIELPDLAADLDLGSDMRMLEEYAELLTTGATSRPELIAQLSDSLLYAGRVKLLPLMEIN